MTFSCHVKFYWKSIEIVYTFRKFNGDICGKKPLGTISILREISKKRSRIIPNI